MVPFKMSSLSELSELLTVGQVIYTDTETVGLYGKVRLLQVYADGFNEVHLVEWPEAFETMVFLGKYRTVWHNAHYDITTLQKNSGTRWIPEHFDDTLLLSRLEHYDSLEFSADVIMKRVLKYDPYTKQGLDKKTLQKTNWGAETLTQDQLVYAATDVYYLPAVYDSVVKQIPSSNYELDMVTLRHCLDFQHNGLPVDEERHAALVYKTKSQIDASDIPINVNSWQQTRPYVGLDASDDLALATAELEGNTRAGAVRALRKAKKLLSFLNKFDTDRIYGYFKPLARSGRLTSNDQNLQQLPRKSKGVFGVAPGSGRVLIYADFAQLELRTICAITKCKLMEQLFREGADLHGYTAEMLFGKDYTPAQRQLTKTYNFSFLYGGGLNMLISILITTAGVLLSESEANRDRARWRSLWREIYAWQERGISAWRNKRPWATPLGRRYTAKMMTDQLNIQNQGAGAEVAKLALHYLLKDLSKHEDTFLCNFIHDSYIIEAPDDPNVYKAVAEDLGKAMQTAWFEMSKLLPIQDLPMPVEVKVGYNWGDIENDDVDDLWAYKLEGKEYATV